MAITNTTNMTGTVGTSTANAVIVAFSPGVQLVEVAIAGATGGARIAKNVTTAAGCNATTNSYITAGGGYRLEVAEPGQPITSLAIYANNSEADLVYSINKILSGVVS